MRWILPNLALSAVLWAQSESVPPVKAVLPPFIEQQRASVLKQVATITGKPATAGSFFTVPWVDSMAARPLAPLCSALPTQEIEQLIEQNSKQEGVKAELIRAVISQESGNKPCALSSKGAQGLMQLMPETAAQFGVGDPYNAKQNVEAGTKLLKQLLAKYKGDVALTLAAYNAGSGRVDREGGVPAIPETLDYVTSILAKLPKR